MIKDKTILIKNIYYMLSYAFTPLTQGGYENVEKEEFENIHNLFAAILAKGIGRQLKQGLYREYVERMESLATLRGKIDINGTVKNKIGISASFFSCLHTSYPFPSGKFKSRRTTSQP